MRNDTPETAITPDNLRHATITGGLSFYSLIRGELWRSIVPFNLRSKRAIVLVCLDNAPIAQASVAGAPARAPRPMTCTTMIGRRKSISTTYGRPPPPARRGPRDSEPPQDDLPDWTVTDDWPECIPVTEAKVDLFERWFGDLFDELFGPRP